MRRMFIYLSVIVLMATHANAVRVSPSFVQPLTHNGITYSAPHQRMGYVVASDAKTGNELWSVRVYGVEYGRAAEGDLEDVYITSLSIKDATLIVTNERGHEFSIDLKTREVISPSKGVVAFENIDGNPPYHDATLVDIQVMFICFGTNEIGALARKGQIDANTLLALWREGKGELIATPMVRTLCGSEAIVKSVKEVTYPTALRRPAEMNARTNVVAREDSLVVPADFETREVGITLTALPELRPGGDTIYICLTPQSVLDPEWRTYATGQPGQGTITNAVFIEQPVFYASSVSTSVCVKNGETILLGGGMQPRDRQGIIYLFLKASIVEQPKGQSSNAPSERPRQ